MALAELLIGWLLIRQAALASSKLAALSEGADSERAYYQGKLHSARYFCTQVLPRLKLDRQLVEASTLDLMAVGDEAFG